MIVKNGFHILFSMVMGDVFVSASTSETQGLTLRDREPLKKQAFDLIFNELLLDSEINKEEHKTNIHLNR